MEQEHNHTWKWFKTAYAEPAPMKVGGNLNIESSALLRLQLGVTTVLWVCSDSSCGATRKDEMLGKDCSQRSKS